MLEDAVRRVRQLAAESGDRSLNTKIGCFGFGWGGMVALMAGRKVRERAVAGLGAWSAGSL